MEPPFSCCSALRACRDCWDSKQTSRANGDISIGNFVIADVHGDIMGEYKLASRIVLATSAARKFMLMIALWLSITHYTAICSSHHHTHVNASLG